MLTPRWCCNETFCHWFRINIISWPASEYNLKISYMDLKKILTKNQSSRNLHLHIYTLDEGDTLLVNWEISFCSKTQPIRENIFSFCCSWVDDNTAEVSYINWMNMIIILRWMGNLSFLAACPPLDWVEVDYFYGWSGWGYSSKFI